MDNSSRRHWGGVGAALLVGGVATVAANVIDLPQRWLGPTGERLLWVSGAVGLPAALCLLGSVLALLGDGRRSARRAARALAAVTGSLLAGLAVTGVVGTIDLALPHHARSPIIGALDASWYAVGFLPVLGIAGCFLVLYRAAHPVSA